MGKESTVEWYLKEGFDELMPVLTDLHVKGVPKILLENLSAVPENVNFKTLTLLLRTDGAIVTEQNGDVFLEFK